MHAAGDIRRVALYGPFGWGNLGDAAIQEAMMHNLRLRHPPVEFLGVSLNPENTKQIHGIAAVPIGRGGSRTPLDLLRELRFLARAVASLRHVDVFVVSGGGQLSDDWGTPWDHPYALLKWMACARLAGTPVYVVSVGAGPIRKPMTARLLRAALRMAQYRSYRDVGSQALMAQFGFTRHDPVYPDLAFSLPVDDGVLAAPGDAAGSPRVAAPTSAVAGPTPTVIGLSPMAYCYPKAGPWPEQDRQRYEAYLVTVSTFAESVLADGRALSLFLSQIRNDRYALDDLTRLLADRVPSAARSRLSAEPTQGLVHVLAQIAHLDVVVTSRLHGVILSYLLHKPVIALSYDPKIRAVMEQFGQEAYCLELDSVTPAQLRTAFEALLDRRPEITQQIAAQVTRHRAQLARQYDALFGPPAASS